MATIDYMIFSCCGSLYSSSSFSECNICKIPFPILPISPSNLSKALKERDKITPQKKDHQEVIVTNL